ASLSGPAPAVQQLWTLYPETDGESVLKESC
ncbi:hypothetical protein Tco_1351073, partial [Tanacetum coccineum]